MKKHGMLSIILTILLLLVLSISAGAVQGILVGPDGTPLTGFSNVYVVNGVAQPVYNEADGKWYNVFITGTGENGAPICHLGESMGNTSENKGDGEATPSTPQSNCFAGDTLVLMADGTTKMLQDITAGDKVRGYDFVAGRYTTSEVISNHPAVQDDYYILNGGLKVTAEHPFFAKNFGLTPASTRTAPVTTIKAKDLKDYAILYGIGKSEGSAPEKLTLNSIIHVKESGTFYNLQVNGTRSFFVSSDGRIFVATNSK
jgi:hypothetical protein